jgi:FkbM family methyltransferase
MLAQRNIALNALEKKVRPINVAAGRARARGTLFIRTDDTLVPIEAPSGTVDVEVRAADDLLREEGIRPSAVRLLKVDVERSELEVQAGARRLLEEGSPIAVFEAITADAKTSLEAHMESLGYVLVRVADDRNLLFARFNEETVHPLLALGVKLGSALLGRTPPS